MKQTKKHKMKQPPVAEQPATQQTTQRGENDDTTSKPE